MDRPAFPFRLRPYRAEDTPAIARLCFDSARALGIRRYSDAQVAAFGDLEPDGHIDHLYCRPDAAGRGVASALLDALIARGAEAGLPELRVEASELARPLFERKGFRTLARRDFEVRGVAIHNYAMRRALG